MAETVVVIQVRMPPALHARLSDRARQAKASFNSLIVTLLQACLERDDDDGLDLGHHSVTGASSKTEWR